MAEDIIENPQHHAYIIFDVCDESIEPRPGKGLYVIRSEKKIGVEEVRWLHDYAYQSVGAVTRKIVLAAPGISVQAQNALLKIIEETQKNVHFFIFFPPGTEIIGTLLSRCYVAEKDDGKAEDVSPEFKKFISVSPGERLKKVDAIWDEGESVRHVLILHLVQDFEKYIHRHIGDGKVDGHIRRCMRATHHLRDAIYGGALHKGTLQMLALV